MPEISEEEFQRESIKPCPFCGSETAPRPLTCQEIGRNMYYAGVTICCSFLYDGCGATCGFHDWTEEQAIKAWNRRHE